jgi:hypothetical protein
MGGFGMVPVPGNIVLEEVANFEQWHPAVGVGCFALNALFMQLHGLSCPDRPPQRCSHEPDSNACDGGSNLTSAVTVTAVFSDCRNARIRIWT